MPPKASVKKQAAHPLPIYLVRLAVLLGILAAILVAYFAWYQPMIERVGRIQVEEAESAFMKGDFAHSLELAQKLLTTSTKANHAYAASVVEHARFMAGDELEKRAVIEAVKERYLVSESNEEKAHIINELLAFLVAGREGDIMADVFRGEPFESYFVPGDSLASMKQLAELSLSLMPSSLALQQIVSWDANQLLTRGRTLGKEVVDQHVRNIVNALTQAESLFAEEQMDLSLSPTHALDALRYYQRSGYLYGAAALIQKEYLVPSEAAYAKAYALFEGERSHGGGEAPALAAWMPYAYMHNALYLNYIGKAARKNDVLERLTSLAALVKEDPNIHANVFLSFVESVRLNPQSPQYANLRMLAGISPEFKALLQEYGWKF